MKYFSTALLAVASMTIAILATSEPASAQTPAAGSADGGGGEAADLAKKLSNPVASLVSVPFQLNWNFGVGPDDNETGFLVNFQPVMPFSINKDWNLIARAIVPYLGQPVLVPGGQTTSGVGDILVSAFVSPANPKRMVWGIGPAVSLPTNDNPFLGTGRWGGGPTVLVLKQAGHMTLGVLANHVWSFGGASGRESVSQTYMQPFVAYGTKSGYTFTLSSESSYNWEAKDSDQAWSVPILFNFSKVLRLGKRPLSVGIGGGKYVKTPDEGPEWKLRMTLTLIFPK